MKKLAIASALLSALAITGTAHAYQAEVGASAGYIDPDHGSSGSEFGVNGTYYFSPVQTRNAPLAEAAFLDRASNVKAHAAFADRGDVDDNTYGAGVEYFVPNSDFYVSGDISRNNLEEKTPAGKVDHDTTYYAAEVGYLPAPGFLVAAGVFITVIIIHHSMSLLIITEPESFITVIIHKIICTLTMLLILKPLAVILFSVRECINAIALAFALYIFAFIVVSIFKNCGTLAIWFSSYHLAFILTSILKSIGAKSYSLSNCIRRQ